MNPTTDPNRSMQARLWAIEDALLRAVLLHDLRAAASRWEYELHPGLELAETCRKLARELQAARHTYNQRHGL